MKDEPLDYFVSTPSGIMHAENHRALLCQLPERSAQRLLLLPAIKVDAITFESMNEYRGPFEVVRVPSVVPREPEWSPYP